MSETRHPFARRKALGCNPTAGSKRHLGVVLPVAMILLIVLSFAGLLAARRSANFEEVANNTRVNHVAKLMAETALRHCEAVVIDVIDNEGARYPADAKRLGQKALASPGDGGALWRQMQQWSENSAHRISVPLAEGAESPAALADVPNPSCIVEPLPDDQFVVTARGLSAGATFDAQGRLIAGAEVWLQSILSPQVPVRSAGGGHE